MAASTIELEYRITYAHVAVGNAELVLTLDHDRYSTTASAHISGIAAWLVNGDGSGHTEGHIEGTIAQPDQFQAQVASTVETDNVTILFKNGSIQNSRVLPPTPPEPKRVPITPDLLEQVIDPLSAAFVNSPSSERDAQPCGRQYRIFDGRRRYDAMTQFDKAEGVSSVSGYKGTSTVCTVHIRPLGGQVVGSSSLAFLAESKEDIEIQYAYLGEENVYVPIGGLVPLSVGALHIDAQQVKVHTPGAKTSR